MKNDEELLFSRRDRDRQDLQIRNARTRESMLHQKDVGYTEATERIGHLRDLLETFFGYTSALEIDPERLYGPLSEVFSTDPGTAARGIECILGDRVLCLEDMLRCLGATQHKTEANSRNRCASE